MEWVEGTRLRSASRQRRAPDGSFVSDAAREEAAEDLRLVEVGVRCSLEQMLEQVGLPTWG
jgi:hypothetical protein